MGIYLYKVADDRQLFPNSRIVDVRFLDKLASGIHPVGSPENMNLRKSLVGPFMLF